MIEIKSGAIFLSDAHDNINKTAFLTFLKKLKNKEIQRPTQLFLLGDMFDFLTNTTYVKKFYKEQIELLNELSEILEIYYFEGNHDFNLSKIFPKIKVFPIHEQPAIFFANNEKISIAHGDIFMNFIDTFALRFLRNKIFLYIMNILDTLLGFKISKLILKSQENKKLDYIISDFENKIKRRIHNFKTKKIIEGHFHQGKNLHFNEKVYTNLSCFAFERSFFIVKYQDNLEFQLIRSPNG